MPNYLQRVILDGARIQSPTRPSAPAPVALPQVTPASLSEHTEPRPQPAATIPPATTPRVAPSAPEPPRPAPPHDPELVVAATPAPRRDPEPVVNVAPAPPQQTVRSDDTPKPRPAQQPVPLSVAIARMTSGSARVRVPKALRPSTPLPPSPMMKLLETPAPVQPREREAVLKTPPVVADSKRENAAALAAERPHAAIPREDPLPAVPREQPLPAIPRVPSQTEAKPAATPPARVAQSHVDLPQFAKPPAAAPAPAPVIAIQERKNARRSQINIGKVEVQVNNRPAQPARTPVRPASTSPRSNFLATPHLSRFALRP